MPYQNKQEENKPLNTYKDVKGMEIRMAQAVNLAVEVTGIEADNTNYSDVIKQRARVFYKILEDLQEEIKR